MNVITSNIVNKIENICKTVKKLPNSEIEKELDLNRTKKDINYEIYLKLIKYLYILSKKENLKIVNENIIDVSYNEYDSKQLINNRITINNSLFDSCFSNFKSNSNKNIYLKLLYQLKRKEKGLSIIKKIRDKKDVYDFEDFNIRFRCNNEKQINEKEINDLINEVKTHQVKIGFRMKKRISLFVKDILRIDLTEATSSNKFDFNGKPSTYELEIEINKMDQKTIDLYVKRLLKLIQVSNTIITTSEINDVNKLYNKLFNKPDDTINTRVDAMNVVSLGIKDLDNLENKYAVTDKADGEHSFLIVCNENIYLISQYFHIKNVGMKVNKKFNGTVIDGEAIFINNKYLFMGFDCLFYCGDDVRNDNSLMNRMEYVKQFCKENFKFNGMNYLDSEKAKNIEDVEKFYYEEFSKFNKDIVSELSNKNFIMRPKYFMKLYGLSNNEIYHYSTVLWNVYNELSKNKSYPYHLDGMVYQPISQTYTMRPSLQIYKWKPFDQNSIDFYLEFKKDENGNILTVYDNLKDDDDEDIISVGSVMSTGDGMKLDDSVNGAKKYRIANLYVGHMDGNIETPVLFNPKLNNPDGDVHVIYIPINEKGYCEDRERNIINDKTVVECYYDEQDNKYFKWKVIRTRYDKTENVMNYQKKYGNNEMIANDIWNCIKYPIAIKDINELASDKYVETKDKLRDFNPIKASSTDEAYYNVDYAIRNAVNAKVDFHNVIKTMLINAYCGIHNGKKMSVFDCAIGKGKDSFNYYNAHVKNMIGMDIDFQGLHNINGAFQKYKNLKQKPNVPFMDFINADFTVNLDAESQVKSGMDNSSYNVRAMNKYFTWKYDVISCHFAFHYFLASEERFNVALNNIKTLLNNGGYVILTLFDGQRVNEYIEKEGKDGVVENYVDVNGIKTLVHKIEKKYDINDKEKVVKKDGKIMFKCGNAIDVFVGEGGINETEYLVDKDYLIEKMEEYGLKLVDTATFEDSYNNLRQYVNEVGEVETKEDMKKFLVNKLKPYYEDNETNKECFKITRLNRYYAFKKI